MASPGTPLPHPEALRPLFAAAEGAVPGMTGAVGGHAPGYVTPGADNAEALERLIAVLTARHPEGGAAFRAVRSWALLIWQPVVLALLSVHRVGAVPRLDRLSQRVTGPSVLGFRVPDEAMVRGDAADLVRVAGQQVRTLGDALLRDLTLHLRMKPVLAERLLADRVLGVVLRQSFGTPSRAVHETAGAWLDAMGLTGRSALMDVTLADGRRWPVLARKACCLEYRVGDGGLCPSCPKQAPDVRAARQRDLWNNHVRVD